MKRIVFLAVYVLLLVMGLTACRQSAAQDSSISIDLQVEPASPTVGAATMTITLTADDGTPITGAAVEVRGDMTHAGMTPVISKAENAGDGTYTTTFEWTMDGDWIVTVTATLADGRQATREFPLSVADS